jgi:hypothetical protein
MDQKAITPYLARKGLSALEIDADLVASLGPELVNYSSVTHYLHQTKFATLKPRIIFLNPNRSSIIPIGLSHSP